MVVKRFIVYSLWSIVLFFSGIAVAQEVSFTASVSRDKVGVGEKFELTLDVSGTQDVGVPEFYGLDKFRVISSGSSSRFSFIDGVMSSTRTFVYTLVAVEEGTLVISSASIKADGQIWRTDPITIEVSKSTRSAPSAPTGVPAPASARVPTDRVLPQSAEKEPIKLDDLIFVTVSADKASAYVGEQIIMSFKFYRRGVTIDNLQYTPPATKGFMTESMGAQKQYREQVNGIVYDVIELETAIFPITSGELVIEPARLKCDLLVRQQTQSRTRRGGGSFQDDFFDSFFDDSFFGSSYSRHPLDLESEPLTISVIRFPNEGKPVSFDGAVGVFDMEVSFSPDSLKVGDPINIVMTVSGTGNIAQVKEPVIKNLDGFRSFDSEVKTEITSRTPKISGKKVFQKVIVPQTQDENIQNIPEINFSYFNPATKQYQTLSKGPFPVSVKPRDPAETDIAEVVRRFSGDEETKRSVEILAEDIHYIQRSPGRFLEKGVYWYNNKFLWTVIFLFPLAGFLGILVHHTHKTRMASDKGYVKAFSARKEAKKLLAKAAAFQKQGNPKEFYDAVVKAILKYVSDRMNIPVGSISRDNIEDILLSKKIKQETIGEIKDLFTQSEMVCFSAGSISGLDMEKTFRLVKSIVSELSKKL